ncbi:MAG: hypothetical protein Q7T25_09100, partial [Sideroxyarcus sp.]|nr:hypothetical protein [Sideroxyarcus sp.]
MKTKKTDRQVGNRPQTSASSGPRSDAQALAVVAPEIRPGQSVELLKELHILTREGKLNQDSRRKLNQVYHLLQFIEKLLLELIDTKAC